MHYTTVVYVLILKIEPYKRLIVNDEMFKFSELIIFNPTCTKCLLIMLIVDVSSC